jgi:hypothetical protein
VVCFSFLFYIKENLGKKTIRKKTENKTKATRKPIRKENRRPSA